MYINTFIEYVIRPTLLVRPCSFRSHGALAGVGCNTACANRKNTRKCNLFVLVDVNHVLNYALIRIQLYLCHVNIPKHEKSLWRLM